VPLNQAIKLIERNLAEADRLLRADSVGEVAGRTKRPAALQHAVAKNPSEELFLRQVDEVLRHVAPALVASIAQHLSSFTSAGPSTDFRIYYAWPTVNHR
jgi:hypothetical protein